MKKLYFLTIAFLLSIPTMNAQNAVTADPSAEFLGFANVFNTPADGGEFVFGSGWGVPDLQTIVDVDASTITLQPNFNTYADNPGDDFWINPTTMLGNKVFEGNTFVEDATLAGSELTFSGGVVSNTLDPSYVAVAFIKVFNADFSVLKEETTPLVGGQNFEVTFTNVEAADAIVQYGWKITGLNANPDEEAALGSIVITDEVLGINDVNTIPVTSYPNPVTNFWNVTTQQNITQIVVYDVLGRIVTDLKPNNTNVVAIDMSSAKSGVYIATVISTEGQATLQLIKK